jgi:hypothetical protein
VNKKKIAGLSRLDNLEIDLLMLIEESKTKDSKQKTQQDRAELQEMGPTVNIWYLLHMA